ncbi:nitroreductase [Viridibacillus sp. FSL E2-0187]|uniref:nitroreductase family protein n=1 Tax=Viridibacillus sp. FSL E2-0187 TaxID=2921362 RepID=UPI0030F64949
MSILEVLKERRAIRNYEDKPVEKEKIEQLLEAATFAPNDRLREPWNFYVIQGEAMTRYEEMAEAYLQERFPTKPHLVESSLKVVTTTPVAIVVTADQIPDKPDDSEDNVFAVSCAIHSMWLAAKELGLGFVWRTRGVGLVHDERMLNFIGSPENEKVIGTVFIGYPEEGREVSPTKRTSYEEKTTWL